jgi:hypothetical protein
MNKDTVRLLVQNLNIESHNLANLILATNSPERALALLTGTQEVFNFIEGGNFDYYKDSRKDVHCIEYNHLTGKVEYQYKDYKKVVLNHSFESDSEELSKIVETIRFKNKAEAEEYINIKGLGIKGDHRETVAVDCHEFVVRSSVADLKDFEERYSKSIR